MASNFTACLVPALPYAAVAVGVFADAADAVPDGNLAAAKDLIRSLDDAAQRGHFNSAIAEGERRDKSAPALMPAALAKGDRHPTRLPGITAQRVVFARDGWRCRWCDTPVIDREATRHMGVDLVGVFPDGNADSRRHGLTLCSSASLDHVVPHSHGGINDDANFVTACWPCQFGRSNYTIGQMAILDPRDRDPILEQEWDGCTWFR